ncbi:minor tail protein [Mycobacterium phage Gravaillia]|uniref:Minor tail protein n=1 Tax=Mycobacterium phage Gancho TaxID=2301613 RepID=A0A385UHL7_9CAUD|nr:minor tail protein [Mycobacterium phage Gancho]WAB10132.1 minor tail protein [Mycobacterium phage Gravaillia]
MTTLAEGIAGLFGAATGVSAATRRGEFTPEVKQQLLERRWAYMNRKVKKPLIRLWDKEMGFIARLENLDSWSWEELATDDGEAKVTFSGQANAWIREVVTYQTRIEEDLHVTIDPDPDKPHDWRNRWGGKVLIVEDDEVSGEAPVTTLHCISNRRHLRGILLGANPVFPMEVQIPKMFLWAGPTAFTCAAATFINLFRLQTLNGFYPVPRNIFAPETWLQNVSPLNWPIQVMPINPVLDQSRWCTIGARWKDAQTVLSPVMKDAGVICRAYTWIPGDPAPYTMFGDLAELLKPTRACIILSFEDKSGYSGPTGTAIDGALNLFAATLDDLITETLFPLDADRNLETDPFFRKLLLVAPKPPPWVFRDVGYGNVKRKTLMIHKQQGTDIVTGGKSPQWVNQAITFAIRYGLSQLAQVVLGQEAPGVEGLDNLYQGQLDDVFLAFARFVNPIRSANAGSYAFREYFEQGSGTAYTLNSIQTLAEGDHKMRAYASMKFDVSDGPLVYGEDYTLGDRVQAEIRGINYVDQILAVKAQGSRAEAGVPVVSFGDDTREEDPVARAFRTIGNVANFGALLASGGDMF